MAETPTLAVSVTLADGGTLYEPGDTLNIAWALNSTVGGEEFSLWQTSRNLQVFIADNAGAKLNLKSRGISKANGRIDHNLVNNVDPKSGTYNEAFTDNPVQWVIPHNLGSDTDEFTIVVHRTLHPAQGGTSVVFALSTDYEFAFTAPTTASDWERGTTQNITWDQTDIDTATEGTLYYRPLGGDNGDWIEIAELTVNGTRPGQTETYSWEIPATLAPGKYEIGMYLDITGFDSTDDTYYAVTDGDDGFTISEREITVVTPAASEKVLENTSEYSITWTPSSGYSSIDELTLYYRVDGGDWTLIEGGVAANNTAAITAFADAAGAPNEVTVTSVAHGLSDGDTVTISGTTNYDGVYVISDKTDDTFEIIHADDGDDATGDWLQGHTWDLSAPSLDAGTYEIALRDSNYDDDGDTQFESDFFRIVVKAVTITFPYNGALLHKGSGANAEDYKITWTYDGYVGTETIDIQIQAAGGDWGTPTTVASTKALNTDEFEWDIDSSFSTGSYNMRVKEGASTYYPATDFIFAVSDPLQDFNRIQRLTSLVAVQKTNLYYSKGSQMTQLTDADGDNAEIDPSNHVAVFSAFQKIFVLDGNFRTDTNHPGFRFVDFGNLRMTGTLQGSLVGGDVLVGVTNGSIIIVDYLETTGGSDYLYGQVISGGTIGAGEEFELNGDNGFTIESFTDPPHWLDWHTVMESGTLPETATIACAWNGRIVMAGNSARPHQWYMTRAGNPFDMLYAAADARSPISGGDGVISEVGDIITALAPYNADTLLIGARREIHIMRGDPAAGGSLDRFYGGDGMFGPHSWCKDSNNIFYWMGRGGLYRAAVGSSYPQQMSHNRIPKLLDGISRKTHWINLVYDVRRNGILIFITNSNVAAKPEDGEAYGDMQAYWYDIATGGLFPESYPASTGVFSVLDYLPETDPAWYVASPGGE